MINDKKSSESYSKNISYLLMEQECNKNKSVESSISKSIRELYQAAVENAPQNFVIFKQRLYDYKTPLVLSLDKMSDSYQTIKMNSNIEENAEELYYLFNGSRRFEDQKCTFNSLMDNKKYDARPYLKIGQNCKDKFQNEFCDESEYLNMSDDKEKWIKENTINLCKSFSKEASCQADYINHQRNKNIGNMIKNYYDRFKKERFDPLFQLKPHHLIFNCEKTDEDKIVMSIKILDDSSSHEWFVELLAYTEATWTNKNFGLKLELVKTYSEDVITLVQIAQGTSYVAKNNSRIIYLSTRNSHEITKRIFAHEFGHVLGFPDCYIEFFDKSKKELVYYENSKENTNIMCSLKEGVRVDENYFNQLVQSSCLFNSK